MSPADVKSVVPIIVSGAAGRMGRMVIAALSDTLGVRLEGALERAGSTEIGRDAGDVAGVGPLHVAVADDLERVLAGASRGAVLIDFSAPAVSAAAASMCAKRGIRVGIVVGTTGLSKEQQAQVVSASQKTAVLQAANFSLGVNVLLGLCSRAAEMLEGFDLEVVEIHHGKKRDAPSGTALRMAEALAEGRGLSLDDVGVYERKGDVGPRRKDEIGVMALRGGDVVGEHTAYLFGAGERVELTHRATSRETFARGAVRAARWLSGKPAGRYDMRDVLGLRGPSNPSR